MDIVGLHDYGNQNLGGFTGVGSMGDVDNLQKALDVGYETDSPSMTGGRALTVESLEASLKIITWTMRNMILWQKMPKTPAFATVEEYNELSAYGGEGGGFNPSGVLPQTEDTLYTRRVNLVKYMGVTKEINHPTTLVRTMVGDLRGAENRSGIMWILRKWTGAAYRGDGGLAFNGVSTDFSGIDTLIDPTNDIDLKGEPLGEGHLNDATQIVEVNFGIATDGIFHTKVLSDFGKTFHAKERINTIRERGNGKIQVGSMIDSFASQAGVINLTGDVFCTRTPSIPSAATSVNAPTAPASIAGGAMAGSTGEWNKKDNGTGTYFYKVTAANRFGESAPTVASGSVAVVTADVTKYIPLTITNAATVATVPEYYRIYRTNSSDPNTGPYYLVLQVKSGDQGDNGTTVVNDLNKIIPNASNGYVGQLTPDIIIFKQLAPLMQMDLAIIAPSIRWMILLYGVIELSAPKKWVRLINIGDLK